MFYFKSMSKVSSLFFIFKLCRKKSKNSKIIKKNINVREGSRKYEEAIKTCRLLLCRNKPTFTKKFQELKVYATVPPPVELKSVLNQGFQDLEKFDSV